jgi:hypothetical protein
MRQVFSHLSLGKGEADPSGPTDHQAILQCYRMRGLEVKHLEQRRVQSDMKETI